MITEFDLKTYTLLDHTEHIAVFGTPSGNIVVIRGMDHLPTLSNKPIKTSGHYYLAQAPVGEHSWEIENVKRETIRIPPTNYDIHWGFAELTKQWIIFNP